MNKLLTPILVVSLGLCASLMGGCDRGDNFTWSQETPDDVVESARKMVVEGRADLLSELIWAEDESQRELLTGIGSVMRSLQLLSEAVARQYPVEIATIREEAEKARAAGETSDLAMRLMSGQRRQRGGTPSRFARSDDPVNDLTQALLTDPYGWVSRSTERVSTQPYSQRGVRVLLDNKPMFGFMTLTMERMEDDKWYISLPTFLPPVRNALPRDEQEQEVLLAVLAVFRNAMDDLRRDVESGRVRNLDHAAEELGKKVALPAILAYTAYMQVIRQRGREGSP